MNIDSPRTALVISPHADDAAAFCGGTLIKWAAEGWQIILVRVTDDARDSVGLTVKETVARNANELHAAAKRLGAADVVDLGFPTDTLADIPLGQLRERFVYLFRHYRPYAVFGFDPYAIQEPNRDHMRIAQATEEAYWVSTFDLHHPEHFAEGLKPFAVCERWYFARTSLEVTCVEDITEHLEAKAEALAMHATMVRNILTGVKLQLETAGLASPAIEAAIEGDPLPLLLGSLHAQGAAAAAAAGLPEGRVAEVYRVVRFGDLEPLMRDIAQPLPGAPPMVKRTFLGDE